MLVGFAGCKSDPARPGALTLNETVGRALVGEGALPWEVTRPLTWSAYRGRAPEQRGQSAASTAYDLVHGMRCTGQRFEFVVIAALRPEQSWVLPSVVADPAESHRMLQHERTHFDLTEVHARRMRRYFSEVLHPCTRPQQELQDAIEHFISEEAAAQSRYDRETSYGRAADRQSSWDSDVAQLLTSFDQFKR
jgi:hypothetical protein